jgi:hypothetical protein
MAQKLDENEMVSFKELLMANSIQVDALAQLLIDEGVITQEKFFTKMNYPAASRGVSFKCFCRFYRSKLRGIKP